MVVNFKQLIILLIISILFISVTSSLNENESIDNIVTRFKNKYEKINKEINNNIDSNYNYNNDNEYKNNKINLWIYFNEKSTIPTTITHINEKSKNRRLIRSSTSINEFDNPINENYINEILKIGNLNNLSIMKKRTESKWLNSVSFTLKINQDTQSGSGNEQLTCPEKLKNILESISKLSFVKKIQVVNQLSIPNTDSTIGSKSNTIINNLKTDGDNNNGGGVVGDSNNNNISTIVNGIDYGQSYFQLDQIKVIDAHKLGYKGKGVTMMVIDTGFQKTHESLKNLKIKGEKNFIENDVSDDTSSDDVKQISHGTFVLSQIGGSMEGKLIGVAPDADFLLAKTEIVAYETPLEEDYLIEAIEWGENNGADVISISLSYTDNYDYWARDGSSPLSKSIDIAIDKGVVVVVASGNDGQVGVGPPGDSKFAITVGAVDSFGDSAIFSSIGPTSDGRLKPDVSARGVLCYGADDSSINSYRYTSGTSHATPLVAGSIALLLEAHPTWTPKQIKEVLLLTSSQSKSPDNIKGFGIINIFSAINTNLPPSSNLVNTNDDGNNNNECIDSDCYNYGGICLNGKCICSHISSTSSSSSSSSSSLNNDYESCLNFTRCSTLCNFNNGKCSEYDCFKCVNPSIKEEKPIQSSYSSLVIQQCKLLDQQQQITNSNENPNLSNSSKISYTFFIIFLISLLLISLI